MIKNLDNEIWKVHPTFDWMAASNFGRIKSLERDVYKKDGSFLRHLQEQLIKPSPNKDGYLQFRIFNTNLGIDEWPYAHRFVFECFHQVIIPKGCSKLQINHLNEIKTDNRIENLELCTSKENCNYGTRNERMAEALSKQVGQYTLDGELVKIWKSTNEAEREGEFTHQAISACCRNCYLREGNNIYKHFIWQFI